MAAAPLPQPCWLDERHSLNLDQPRKPGILAGWRQVENERGQVRWEGFVVTVEVSGAADWRISGAWHRASKIDQVNPLSDRELEASRQASRATD